MSDAKPYIIPSNPLDGVAIVTQSADHLGGSVGDTLPDGWAHELCNNSIVSNLSELACNYSLYDDYDQAGFTMEAVVSIVVPILFG